VPRVPGGGVHDLSARWVDVTWLSSRWQTKKPPSAPTVTEVQGAGAGGAGAERRSDAELARKLWDADATALSGLYQRFGHSCYSLARRVCGDDGLAEDVVHEVFLTLWRDPSCGDPARGSIATRLVTLVHHKAVDALRATCTARQRRAGVPEADESTTAPGADQTPRNADQAPQNRVAAGQVRAALERLPGEQRQVLAAAYFDGHTLPEIAASSCVPLDMVESRLVAGVRRLRSLLTEQLGPDALIAEMRTCWELSR
jgi:RNA polymerase sigma factor (sigma-70 family)